MKLKDHIGNYIKLEISGNKAISGILIDIGSDLWVIYNGYDYLYIPTVHIQNWKFPKEAEIDEIITLSDDQSPLFNPNEEISLEKPLQRQREFFQKYM